jgi:hypothetical protein
MLRLSTNVSSLTILALIFLRSRYKYIFITYESLKFVIVTTEGRTNDTLSQFSSAQLLAKDLPKIAK